MTYLFNNNATILNEIEVKNDTGNALPVVGNVTIINSGSTVSLINPLPVTLGSSNIQIFGNTNILDTVNVASSPENPVHVHLTELGTGNVILTNYVPIQGNVIVSEGNITVIPSPISDNYFGEPYSIPLTPVVQTDGRYGTKTLDHQLYTANGGNVTHNGGAFNISCTNTTGSYAFLRSRRFNTFKPGQSFIARWFAKLDTPTANTSQRLGVSNQECGYYFGLNGTQFGVLHTYNAQAPIHHITINSYTGTQTLTITLNSIPYTVTIQTGETVGQACNRISKADFGGLWLASDKDNTVELLYTGVSSLSGSFSITSNGTFSGSITQDQTGVAATNDWYYNGVDFNMPTWFHAERYNQYQVKYSWAGINFFVLNPTTGNYELFYQLTWSGSASATQLPVSNPAFKIAALAINNGSNTGVTVNVATMMLGLEGITNRNGYTGAAAATKSSLTQNILHHLISIKNPYTWNSTINTIETILCDFVATTQCNDPTEVYLYIDAVLQTGTHDFTSQDNLPVTISTVTGTLDPIVNSPILSFVVGNTGSSVQFTLEQYRVVVPPGSTVTIAIRSTAAIQKAAASITWYND